MDMRLMDVTSDPVTKQPGSRSSENRAHSTPRRIPQEMEINPAGKKGRK